MKNNMIYNYGECEICGTEMEEKFIKQDFWLHNELIIVENVPAGVCPHCGEKIVNAETGRLLMKIMNNPEQIKKSPRISVPSIKFNPEETIV